MKRFVTIAFTILYLLPAVGFSMDIHWCGKKINSISFGYAKEKKCPCGKKMSGCCKDFHAVVKLDDSHKAVSSLFIDHNDFEKTILPNQLEAFSLYSGIKNSDSRLDYFPPILSRQPVYLFCSVFRV